MSRPFPVLLALCLGLALPGRAVETITNPAVAPEHRDIVLEEQWRIGGADDEENILGVISEVLADDQGRLYLLDLQLVEVMVYDAEGEYLLSLGQAGEGPGEIRRPAGMIFMPDGTLGLVQAFPGKVVQVRLDGNPAGEYHPGGADPASGGFFALQGARCRGGSLVFSGGRMSRGEGRMTADQFVAHFDEKGAETARYHGQTQVREFRQQEVSEKDQFFPHDTWDLGLDGRVFIAESRNDYAISVYSPDGQIERTITRPYESYKRNETEKQEARAGVMPWRRRNRRAMNIVVEPTDRDIRRLHVAEDGRLWVLSSRSLRDQPAGVHSTWDVFDTAGRFAQTVSLHCEGRAPEDRIFFAGEDRAVLVRRYAEALKAFRGSSAPQETTGEAEILDTEPLEVIVYRLKP